MNKYAVLSLSGGMDSSSLLINLLAQGVDVTALSFDYGQKHRIELERAVQLVAFINANAKINLGQGLFFKPIKHRIIKLEGLSDLLNSSLVEGGDEVPEGHYASENMKETVVPNRNKIFSSIIQAVALSIANRYNDNVSIALGIHSGDHEIYRDCRQSFRDADFIAFQEGNDGTERVSFYTPYLYGTKFDILSDGENNCDLLGLNFDEVYKRTNTSYKPTSQGYSDFKSAASVERVEAFLRLGRPDPVQYGTEEGPVSWDIVVDHVLNVLSEYQKSNRDN